MSYFLDTNICIYFLKGISKNILNKLEQMNPTKIKIPAIVKAELLFGVEKSSRKKQNEELVKNFLSPFEIVPFDEISAEYYSKVRISLEKKGISIGPNDLFIASIVLAHKGTLVTNNVKEFGRIKGLKVANWV